MTNHGTIILAVLIAGLAIGGFGALIYAPPAMSMRDEGGCGSMMSHMDSMMGDMSSHCQGRNPESSIYPVGNAVSISGFSSSPQTLKVQAGTSVTWSNMDAIAHTVESGTPETPTGLFSSGLLGQGETFSYTFSSPGAYVYYCSPHPYVKGMIVVE